MIEQAVNTMQLGAVNSLITKLTFRFMLLKRAYTAKEFEEMIVKTNFLSAQIAEELIGLEVSLKKGSADSIEGQDSLARAVGD